VRLVLFWLAAFAAPILAGIPVGFVRALGSLSAGARLALSAAAGWFSIALWMTLLATAGVRWNPFWLMVLTGGANALLASLLDRRSTVGLQSWTANVIARRLGLLLLAVAVLVAVSATIAGAATSADLLLFWGPKGQAFGAARTIDVGFLADPAREYLHASYPPLLTNLYAFATMIAGRFSWLGATATFALFAAGLALALPGMLRLSTTADRAAVSAAVIVCGIVLLGMEADVAGNGEMPLLFFETLAMAILISPAAVARPMQLVAGMLLGGAACTKVEGLPYVIAAVTIFLLLRRRQLNLWPSFLRLAGPTALSLAVWFLFGASTGLFRGYQGSGALRVVYPDTVGDVLAGIARELWRVGYGLPFLAAAALVAVRGRPLRPALLPLGTAAALGTFFVLTYLHEPKPPALWISWTAARIYSPLVPLLALGAIAPSWSGAGTAREPDRVASA